MRVHHCACAAQVVRGANMPEPRSIASIRIAVQDSADCACTAVCCATDGTVYVGDTAGSVWALGSGDDGAARHGQAVVCPGAAIQCLAAEADRMIVATDGGRVYGFRCQDGCWAQVSEVRSWWLQLLPGLSEHLALFVLDSASQVTVNFLRCFAVQVRVNSCGASERLNTLAIKPVRNCNTSTRQ